MKKILLIIAFVTVSVTVKAQMPYIADEILRMENADNPYKELNSLGFLIVLDNNTGVVTATRKEGFQCAVRFTMYPNYSGTFDRIVVDYIGGWNAADLIDQIGGPHIYNMVSDKYEYRRIGNQTVPRRTIRLKCGGIMVAFIDPYTAPKCDISKYEKWNIPFSACGGEFYDDESPNGDFTLEYTRVPYNPKDDDPKIPDLPFGR